LSVTRKPNPKNSDEGVETLIPDPDSQQKIFEVQYFCSRKYFCRQQQISAYYAWDGDAPVQDCGKCDNCVSRTAHNVQDLPDAINDIYELLEVIKSLTTQHACITPRDVIDVYTHAKTKELERKEYLTSEAYKRTYTRKVLVSKELASQALDDLVASGYVKQACTLKKQKERQMTCSTYIQGVKENAEILVGSRSWVYRALSKQRRGRK
jgi:hypothetical protein